MLECQKTQNVPKIFQYTLLKYKNVFVNQCTRPDIKKKKKKINSMVVK